MKSNIISSAIGNQFHPMVSVLLVIFTIPLWASENYVIALIMIVLAAFLIWKDKIVKVDIENKVLKEGWFSSWKEIYSDGYLSVFPERESQVMRSRVSEGSFTMKNIYVNYIAGNKKEHLYKAKSMDEAKEIALSIHSQWDCGVYDGVAREWIEPQENKD